MGLRELSLTLLLAVTAEGANAASEKFCPYKLVAFDLNGKRAYGILEGASQAMPNAVLPVDFLGEKTTAAELLSAETAAKLSRIACAKEKKPERFRALVRKLAPEAVLAPLPQPRNIVAIGLNYAAHNEEVDIDDAVLFPKNVPLTGAYARIQRPPGSLLDWEVELAYVVRKEIPRGTVLTEANSAEYIAGYVLANDVTNRVPIIRDLKTGFTKGKTHPTFLPIGPYFVPIESVPAGKRLNPELAMSLTVNGREKQKANTREMLQSLPKIVDLAYARSDAAWEDAAGNRGPLLHTPTFVAGDLLITGTPGGTAISAPGLRQKLGLAVKGLLRVQNPKLVFTTEEYCSGKYLRDGDEVSAAIEGLGTQKNLVTEDESLEPKVACPKRTLLPKNPQ